MSVTLSDEQYQIMVHALLEIAHGRWYRNERLSKRFSRVDCVERARRAAIDLGFDWASYKPEKPDPRTTPIIVPRPDPVPPNPRGRPRKGMAAFIRAGQGAQ